MTIWIVTTGSLKQEEVQADRWSASEGYVVFYDGLDWNNKVAMFTNAVSIVKKP